MRRTGQEPKCVLFPRLCFWKWRLDIYWTHPYVVHTHCLMNSIYLEKLLTSCLERVPKSEHSLHMSAIWSSCPSMAGGVQSGGVPMVTMHMSLYMGSTAGRIYTSVLVDLDCPRMALDNSTTWDVIFPSSCQIVILSTQLFKGKSLMAQLTWLQRGQCGQ